MEGTPGMQSEGVRRSQGVKKILYTSIVTSVPLKAGVRDCGSM